ncbi:MAG: hypothetical protein ABIM17_07025 [candidate division WOR-3 bacterium]
MFRRGRKGFGKALSSVRRIISKRRDGARFTMGDDPLRPEKGWNSESCREDLLSWKVA